MILILQPDLGLSSTVANLQEYYWPMEAKRPTREYKQTLKFLETSREK